jgi:NTE family protein
MFMTEIKIGLALGGGGARGLAHIGVLKVLLEEGISINFLSGTSMGGVIASAYAVGYSPDQLYEEAIRMTQLRQLIRLVDPAPARRGLLEGNRVKAYLAKFIGSGKTFLDTRYPLSLCAVDINPGQEVMLSEGDLLPAVFSTVTVPGLFAPISLGKHILVDGGVLNNVPADLVQNLGANFVIAVDVMTFDQSIPTQDEGNIKHSSPFLVPEFFMEFYQAMQLMVAAQTKLKLEKAKPDVIIQPGIPNDINMFLGFTHATEIISAGERAARDMMPSIHEKLRILLHSI